jgi:glycosyltransferase involved in cell wall biosynthesis
MENQVDQKIRILLVGPQSLLISGTRIPFRQLQQCLRERSDVELVILDTDRVRGSGFRALPRFLKLILKLLVSARICDVISLHASVTAMSGLGPFVALAARMWRKPIVTRQFGGMAYNQLSRLHKALSGWFIKRCDIYMVETKQLMRSMEGNGIVNLKWYPNSRPLPRNRPEPSIRPRCHGRFVFVGQLKIEKGLGVLVEAVEASNLNAVVDVYGPWHNLPRNTFDGCTRVFYKGELRPEDVLSTIEQYDALVTPTFLPDEGHSGVIIEAYQVGRPVIGTRWNALPEIITDQETGLLVEPRSAISLRQAFARLMESPSFYQQISRGALECGRQFSTEARAEELVNLCKSLVGKKPNHLWSEADQFYMRSSS